MKGFLRRDLCLLKLGAWFYLLLAIVYVLGPWSGAMSDYGIYFLLVFGMESLYGLMAYDEMGAWRSYAAAVPDGRKRMVDARYLLTLCMALLLAVLLLLYALLQGKGLPLWTTGFYTAAFLLILSVTLPVCYRWGYGGTRGRLVVLISTFVPLGVMGGIFTGVLSNAREDLAQGALRADVNGFFTALAGVLPLLGLGALALSWRVSRHIMEKKEF